MKKAVAAYMTLAFSAAMSGGSVFLEPKRNAKPLEPIKPFDERLADNGLQRFIINGKEIIAHNEKEANKRYRHNYK